MSWRWICIVYKRDVDVAEADDLTKGHHKEVILA